MSMAATWRDASNIMSFHLERAHPTPIYRQIEDWMRQQIASGNWVEHYKLKSENDLALELNVNRGTVRKATDALIADGLLVRIHGRGTFVASKTLEQPLAESLMTSSEDLISKSIPFKTHVLAAAVRQPSARVASLLSIQPESPVFYLKRLRDIGQTRVLLENYVVYNRCTDIEQVDFTRHRLFEVLENRFKLRLDWGRRDFEAQLAGRDIAEILTIAPGDPVMYMQQVTYLNDGSPIELSDLWVSGKDFRLSAIVKRESPVKHSGAVQDVR